jgi:hypothetical protein
MASTCVVGLQWGDEAKGKIVDLLTDRHDFVVRFNGGANAGHTVVSGGQTFKLSLLPTGVLRPNVRSVIANGVVVYPPRFLEEVRTLPTAGVEPQHSHIECLGAGDCVPGVTPQADAPEVVLRVAVRDVRRAVVERFTKEFAPLVTSGPPGVTSYTTGRPAVREVFAYWPALLAKDAATPAVQVVG